MFGIFNRKKSLNHEENKRRFTHPGAFSVLAPADWVQDQSGGHFSLSPPDDAASFAGNAYRKNKNGINGFTQVRFESVQEFYSIIDEKNLKQGHLTVVTREYEGIWPDESEPTYYVVNCIETKNLLISLSITTSREVFNLNREQYENIVLSILEA